MSTEFFSSVETYSFTREKWADITGLSENAEAKDFTTAFKVNVREAFAEDFFHVWEPKPSIKQQGALDDRVEREAATIPITVTTFEAGDTVIAEYITDVGLTEEDEAPREKPSQLAPALVGAAVGGATYWFMPGKNQLSKILASAAAGVVVWFSVKKK